MEYNTLYPPLTSTGMGVHTHKMHIYHTQNTHTYVPHTCTANVTPILEIQVSLKCVHRRDFLVSFLFLICKLTPENYTCLQETVMLLQYLSQGSCDTCSSQTHQPSASFFGENLTVD